MRLPGFGKGTPLKPGLGGLTGKPAFFEKIGDPGDLTGKIFRGIGIQQAQTEAPESRKAVLAEPTAVEQQNIRERAAENKKGRTALLVNEK